MKTVELCSECSNLRKKHKKGTVLANIIFIVYLAFVAGCWRRFGKAEAELDAIRNVEK